MGHEPTLLAALLIGLAGSPHCLGMCGGIAGTLGVGLETDTAARRWILALGYNLGRLASYTFMGAVAGLLLSAVGATLPISGWAVLLRLMTAAILLAVAAHLLFGWAGLRRIEIVGARLWQRVGPYARNLLPVRTPGRAIALGALWGWLPCGLVYTVLIAAAASGSGPAGAATMFAFGLGTLPAMTGVTVFGQALRRWQGKRHARVLTGGLLLAFALWTAASPAMHVLSGHEPAHDATGTTRHGEAIVASARRA